MDRGYRRGSELTTERLFLDLAPALSIEGVTDSPGFFRGFATRPLVLTRGLLALAEITRTRYFRPEPQDYRDPVLTASGDRLRAECFSACNGVYARLDLSGDSFDGGAIGYGTTNVDLGPSTVSMLSAVPRTELLHVDVSARSLTVSTPDRTENERKVSMPERWVQALGNAASLMQQADHRFTVGAVAARKALAGVPTSTGGREKRVWWKPVRGAVESATHSSAGAVPMRGIHRLSAVKKLALHLESMSVYEGPAVIVVEFGLPAATFTLALTKESHRGFSGEGSLLQDLVSPLVEEDADRVAARLAFQSVIRLSQIEESTGLDSPRVTGALAYLAAAGRVGWDNLEHNRCGAFFHRELPLEVDRVDRANPRLIAARRLVENGQIEQAREFTDTYMVPATGNGHYLVTPERCSCQWYIRHEGLRGPCKHMLAVEITLNSRKEDSRG
ncbi:SWIM zinc finger family protein [Corynebacterium sp.]|uniref:SWIM zinc finger family protein n=1 Tax=Corynebacterium sp. TaxID=1720 RepID=UPI003B3A7ED6